MVLGDSTRGTVDPVLSGPVYQKTKTKQNENSCVSHSTRQKQVRELRFGDHRSKTDEFTPHRWLHGPTRTFSSFEVTSQRTHQKINWSLESKFEVRTRNLLNTVSRGVYLLLRHLSPKVLRVRNILYSLETSFRWLKMSGSYERQKKRGLSVWNVIGNGGERL